MTHKLLIYGSVSSPLIPLVFCWVRRLKPSQIQIFILIYLTASLVADVVSLAAALSGKNTYLILHIFGLIEFLVLVFYFAQIFKWKNWVTVALMVLYSTFSVINSLFLEGYYQFNSNLSSFTALVYIFLALIYFYRIFKNETEIFVEKLPDFWFNLAIITYFSASLFSYILSSDILSKPMENLLYSWAFHNLANILKNILFAIGLWKARTA